ncbi:MAG: gamma-glutamyltransferase [Fimbriimonadaceae bacterium]|nr:gamma-glutamyltransferase [Alphaproteobacteria bacterium]
MNRGAISGAVAAGHSKTAEAAAAILRDGGNAFDAAIAGLWMACVVEPVLASPGGGGFLLALQSERQQLHLFDFFVQTPSRKRPIAEVEFKSIDADFGTAIQEFHVGAGSSAVPGFIPGLHAVHEALATIPMTRLAEQAIDVARRGVEVNGFQAQLLDVVKSIYLRNGEARALFAPQGHLVKQGEIFRNPHLADAMDAMAREGARIATEGEIARAMLQQTAIEGCLRASDLKNFRVELREPDRVSLNGQTIFLNPPPSSGGSLIGYMLRQAKAQKARALPPSEIAQIMALTDRQWRRAAGDLQKFLNRPISQSGGHSSRGTTHISVIDRHGNAAAVTVSNGEGNGLIVPDCGFMVNNMLGEEDLNQGGFYTWKEDARLSSMMAPTIAVSPPGGVTVLGSGGSNRIRSAVCQVLVQLIVNGVGVEDAVFAPRLHVEQGHLDFEDFFEPGIAPGLMRDFPDHRVWPERNLFFGGAHVVRKTHTGSIEVAGDPRRAGVAVLTSYLTSYLAS